jgi:hypothetical protein
MGRTSFNPAFAKAESKESKIKKSQNQKKARLKESYTRKGGCKIL